MIFLRFVGAFVRAKWWSVNGWEPVADAKTQRARGRICKGCDFQTDGECQKCGCLVISKTMMASEKCPIGKWGRRYVRRVDA